MKFELSMLSHKFFKPFSSFRYKYFPNQRSGVQGFGAVPQPRAEFRAPAQDADPRRRYDWGRGNVLGGQN